MFDGLVSLDKHDLNSISESVARSFFDYPIMKYMLQENQTIENIKICQKMMINYGIHYAEAYATSNNYEGVIIFTDYDKYNFSMLRSLRCGLLSILKMSKTLDKDFIKRFLEIDSFTTNKHRELIKEKHQYLMMISVDPKYQGMGFSSKLLLPFLKLAENKNQPCYTETHGDKNLNIYLKYGFKLVSEDIIPNTDIVQYSMIKPPY